MTREELELEGKTCCCGASAEWTWHDGMWCGGSYCADCIREELTPESRFSKHRDAVTTGENVTTIGRNTAIIPAGAQPIDGTYPTIRTKEALDRYVE